MSKSERADDLFILETLQHCEALNMKDMYDPFTGANVRVEDNIELATDIGRAIRILEDRKSERVRG